MSTILADTVRKTGGTLGVDIRIKNNSVCESEGGTSVTTSISQGLAKSWIDYKGTSTNAIMDSLNITSVTDNGTGDYTIVINNNMSSAEYAIVDGTYRSENSNSPGITGFQTPASGQYIHNNWNSGMGVSDMFRTYSQVLGDLA
tara:strand:- start:64 stop:495 length:432 start_codon:yes stop_codon:yes gene_type:complete